ncbi:hypothetical protein OGAPHI_005850 [Ogataea philodendri]|uniref:Uncharacterized protein n=1 Tax=Ogataea philodendri TaxID=1378263 RepID=A0A9P8T1A9_9ASCO|nr:uncharacterized protein OGAPHI_005850 [Ogataea philodendri]KAH3662598.1 hypothetical protein OGAPHI_005850 [Ogataea philodendri]
MQSVFVGSPAGWTVVIVFIFSVGMEQSRALFSATNVSQTTTFSNLFGSLLQLQNRSHTVMSKREGDTTHECSYSDTNSNNQFSELDGWLHKLSSTLFDRNDPVNKRKTGRGISNGNSLSEWISKVGIMALVLVVSEHILCRGIIAQIVCF